LNRAKFSIAFMVVELISWSQRKHWRAAAGRIHSWHNLFLLYIRSSGFHNLRLSWNCRCPEKIIWNPFTPKGTWGTNISFRLYPSCSV